MIQIFMLSGADEHFQLPADFAKEIGNAISMADDFFPEAFKISKYGQNWPICVASFLTLTRKSIHFTRSLTDTKNAQRKYINYRGRSKTRKNIIKNFYQVCKTVKNIVKNSFSPKMLRRDEKIPPCG